MNALREVSVPNPKAIIRLPTLANRVVAFFFSFFLQKSQTGLASLTRILILSGMVKQPDITIPDDLTSCQALIHEFAFANAAKDQQVCDQGQQLRDQGQQLRDRDQQLRDRDQQLRDRDIQRQQQEQQIEKLSHEYEELQLAYNKLLQQRFGNRSERYIEAPDQLRLDFGDTDEAADAAIGLADAVQELEQTIPEHKRRKPRKKRDEGLPDHLPRYEVTAKVPDEMTTCPTHGERTLLPESMWDQTETLEFERPKLKVRVTKFPKYACQGEPQCGIDSPERPTGIVEGNKYDTRIAAEIITDKYSYHLPLYRLQDYFAGCGWTPSRSTQCNILSQSYFVIDPLLEFFKTQVQNDSIVGCAQHERHVALLENTSPVRP